MRKVRRTLRTRFQSTLPRRERQNSVVQTATNLKFQSTLPRRERLCTPSRLQNTCSFQSTLPRRERQTGDRFFDDDNKISIHAPAKGATFLPGPPISQPLYFNPRSREGSDDSFSALTDSALIFQSTLPRRERPSGVRAAWVFGNLFQSTLPRRERQQHMNGSGQMKRFQSTLPRRERQDLISDMGF